MEGIEPKHWSMTGANADEKDDAEFEIEKSRELGNNNDNDNRRV